MHYYKFNIGDWNLHTSHLSLEEEVVYFRLINFYYDSEQPIPEETQTVIRRLRLGNHSETVGLVLREFFDLQADGWHHKRCDEEIEKYHQKAERNKNVGKLGGRPKKINDLESNPKETQMVSKSNPDITLTTNHKPITTNQKPVVKTTTKIELPDWLPIKAWDEWVEYRRSSKKPMSQLASTKFLNQLETFVKDGYDPVKLIDLAIASGWRTVYPRDEAKTKGNSKPEWMKGLTYVRS